MVDAPRYTRSLTGPIDALGGVAHVLLTHRDDVADAPRWAERYGARVWIHEADRSAAPRRHRPDPGRGGDRRRARRGGHARPRPHPGVGRVRRRRHLAVHRRLVGVEPPAPGPGRLPGRLLVLVGRRSGARWPAWRRRSSFSWVLPGHGARVGLDADDAHRRLVDAW